MLCCIAGLAGCQKEDTVTIFAAASTIDALDEVIQDFHDQYQGLESERPNIRMNYAATSTLGNMILNGAESDLFLAADADWAHRIRNDLGRRIRWYDLFTNRLVLIASTDVDMATLSIGSLEDLRNADTVKRIAIGDPAHVPAGKYAKGCLEEANVWQAVESRVVAASDVRHALSLVQQGAADVGIVYASDLVGLDVEHRGVEVLLHLEMPNLNEASQQIVYSLIGTNESDGGDVGDEVMSFVAGKRAAKIFASHGFGSLRHPEFVAKGIGTK